MKNVVRKLNSLSNIQSFLQINLIKGYRYIDMAGSIINLYHKNNVAPQFSMNLTGLIIDHPLENIDQMKITPDVFWMKFNKVDSLDMISNVFFKESKKVLEVLGVEKINRIGWRNYFIFEFENQNDQDKFLERLTPLSDLKKTILRGELKTNKKFQANLVLQPVVKNTESQKKYGILFDIDLFQEGNFEIAPVTHILKEFKDYLNDDEGFLKILNESLK